ncbi:uncharacterized protein Dana_GF28071 [Drosophila ananassae]|uniref:Uncharacterized protein n=1 Tax=Drosophila ananassae TaxID=7217 RepID=A0A0P8YET7_DROAN|nr:uncharacterized protein Dana_GF28071 [Drosophila ananassae]
MIPHVHTHTAPPAIYTKMLQLQSLHGTDCHNSNKNNNNNSSSKQTHAHNDKLTK